MQWARASPPHPSWRAPCPRAAIARSGEVDKALRLVITFSALKRSQFLAALEERLAPPLAKVRIQALGVWDQPWLCRGTHRTSSTAQQRTRSTLTHLQRGWVVAQQGRSATGPAHLAAAQPLPLPGHSVHQGGKPSMGGKPWGGLAPCLSGSFPVPCSVVQKVMRAGEAFRAPSSARAHTQFSNLARHPCRLASTARWRPSRGSSMAWLWAW